MGDIARHRNIYLNTRDAIPQSLLKSCRLTREDLTYVELGNYLTDVSQFRDPVSYLFAKRKVWRENVLPQAGASTAKAVGQVLGVLAAGVAAMLAVGGKTRAAAGVGAAAAGLFALTTNEVLAGIGKADTWIDRMLGTPIERIQGNGRNRPDKAYGELGRFFQYFIDGITHLLFAAEATRRVGGTWEEVGQIPEADLAAVFKESFTQYYPHEHTDQPPYVWDASKRPSHPDLYEKSKRQVRLDGNSGGIMNAVDSHYIKYLAEGLSALEAEWRRFKPGDLDARRKALVRTGKLLHGVEDWFFHSNVVEFVRLREFQLTQVDGADGQALVDAFVTKGLKAESDFLRAKTIDDRTHMQRRLYRRFRFPVYEPGDRVDTAGKPSKKSSTLRLDLVYPAFPSQLDTTTTLLGGLENLERKIRGIDIPPFLKALLAAFAASPEGRKLFEERAKARGVRADAESLNTDVLREWLPLVLTLLDEDERQRLVANVSPQHWTGAEASASSPRGAEGAERAEQLKRHATALKPKLHSDGITENNYARAVRLATTLGYLAPRGRDSLNKAFEIDAGIESFDERTPGCGGFLIQFAIQLQTYRDGSDAESKRLNGKRSLFDARTHNGSEAEVIGSHSLMSKDTEESSPFVHDATVLASVASQAVLHLLLDEVSSPASESGLDWRKILQYFIRYPVRTNDWEVHALAFFREHDRIPAFADLPEFAPLRQAARLPLAAHVKLSGGRKAEELELRYLKLEKDVAPYRYL